MTTNSSPSQDQDQDHPSHPRRSMPSEQPPPPPYGFEKRLRSKLHEGWQAICVGTALCDFCGKQSRGVVQKCVKCGLSICSPCSSCGALRGNRNHRLDHDAVCWDRHAIETKRCKRGGSAKMVKRARRLRGGRVSGEEREAAVDGPRPRRRRQGGRKEEEEDNREEGGGVVSGKEAPCPAMYSGRWLEKATQTPGWWVPERPRGVLLPPMDSACPPRCHRADEQDAASILAGMPLSGAEACERTMLDGRCQRGVANAWCHFGGPQAVLSRDGVHNPEQDCFVSGKAGHYTRASPVGPGDPLRTRPFTPINGATTPSFTRDLCSLQTVMNMMQGTDSKLSMFAPGSERTERREKQSTSLIYLVHGK
ncbi:hypothetical protein E4U14_002823 [Claviceps sp. LM454 group G7]|nr:hypothetical protein E4U14_002823 [Claviceps sp. LM454 group G7]